MGDRQVRVGSLTTVLRHVELPAISLTGPGDVTPAPSAQAMLSPAPATTGTDVESPKRRTREGRSSPTTLHDGYGTGSCDISRPTYSTSSGDHCRLRRLSNALAAAIDQSVTASPVSVSATSSVGCDEEPGRPEDVRLVGANPEDFRGNVKGGRHMTRQGVQLRGAEVRVERFGFGDGPVVAVDEPGAQRCSVIVKRDHRRALAGESDGVDGVARHRVV